VYLTRRAIPEVPDGTYCSACVALACDEPFVLSEADGSFALPVVSGEGQRLVVQKGEFRRVVELDVMPGSQAVPEGDSHLPGRWSPDEGMWIPRIAVYDTSPDRVYNVLAKFGLAELDEYGNMVLGTENFTLIPSGDGSFMDDPAALSRYHIVFVPCAATKFWPGAPLISTNRVANIRDYVAGGGKWYATDHSNEYIAEPFPSYQDFHNPTFPDLQPAFESQGKVIDDDLLAWLDALPANLKDIGGGNPTLDALPAVTTRDNFSGIDAIHEVWVENDEGESINVGHHAYVEGPCLSCSDPVISRPMAVAGQYGCGRMMFSTFETSSTAHVGLSPQELILLYMILEIGVCQEEPAVPPPL
jgi:hypothetical protein